MTFHIITLFPNSFDSYINESILARAKKEKKIKFNFYNPRDYVAVAKQSLLRGKPPRPKGWLPYLRVDDKPYGGGPGMVMQAVPIVKAIEKALTKIKKKSKCKIIFLSPGGKQFDTNYAKTIAKKYSDIVIICGRYEGIDARVKKIFNAEEISVGPFILTGGELPAMIIADCVSRQIKGVLGDFDSLEENRISSGEVYTRPEVLVYKGKKYKVPAVLLSGNHAKIEEWRRQKN